MKKWEKHVGKGAGFLALAIICALTLCTAACAGSAGVSSTTSSSTTSASTSGRSAIEQTATEIGTYERVDPNRTQLVIGIVGSEDISGFITGFEKTYPDIQPIVVYLQSGTDFYSPANEWVKHGFGPDIIFNLKLESEDRSTYLEDLTNTDAAARYELSALAPLAQDGRIYALPGPSKVMGIAYNKTLFERYGWQIPRTFDEFLTLCDRIDADTGGTVVPYNANAKYAADFLVGLEGFSYGQTFAGVDNAAWYDGVVNGSRTMQGHMEPFFAMVQKLIDHGLLTADSFNYSYTTRNKAFCAGNIAMINDYTVTKLAMTDGSEIAWMAFPSTDGKDGYLMTRSNYTVCETVRDRSDAEAQAADEFLSYISTTEAQEAYVGDSLMISHVTGMTANTASAGSEFADTIAAGRIVERASFIGGAIPNTLNIENDLREISLQMAEGTLTTARACTNLDDTISSAIADPESSKQTSAVKATVAADFSVLQTSEYIADMFRNLTGADIALIPNNSIYRGNIHRMFAGDLTEDAVTNMLPRSFENGSTLVKVEMTGAQIMDAINDPPGYNGADSDCIYAFSGLHATVAPTNELGSKYLSVTLADGNELDADATYTVAFWQGMVKDKHISDIVQTYEGSYTDLLAAQVESDETLTPTDDGRITLDWE